MHKRKLGQLEVSALGLGCMGMSWAYGEPDDAESLKVLHRSLEIGCNFWDTAEIYGPFKNEELLGRALKSVQRDKVVVATKFAWEFNSAGERTVLNSRPEHIKKTVEGSLKRLGIDTIDLYYQHRLDPHTPIEETMSALKELVQQGKVRAIGLSEVGPDTIRRAHKVHPLTAVQSEYSMWERGVEAKVLPTLKELGIGFVAYSPIGRGFLGGKINTNTDFGKSDSRASHPRFQGENLKHNLQLLKDITAIADSIGATAPQLAIAWLLRQGDHIVPIPGTKRVGYLEENVAAEGLKLSETTLKQIDEKLASFKTAGTRYAESMMKLIDTAGG